MKKFRTILFLMFSFFVGGLFCVTFSQNGMARSFDTSFAVSQTVMSLTSGENAKVYGGTYYYNEEIQTIDENYSGSIYFDSDSEMIVQYILSDDTMFEDYFFDHIKMKNNLASSSGSYFNVGTGKYSDDGEKVFEGTCDENGYFLNTISGITFRFKSISILNEFDGLEVRITNASSLFTLVASANYFSSDLDLSVPSDFGYNVQKTSSLGVSKPYTNDGFKRTDTMTISLSHGLTTIVDTLTIMSGSDTSLVLHGGMQTGGNYVFKEDYSEDFEYFSYGNYALSFNKSSGYVVKSGPSYNYIEKEEKVSDSDYFVVRIDDNGTITITKSNITKNILIAVSEQKYAQINLLYDENFSTEGFISETINGVSGVCNRRFVVGFLDSTHIEIIKKSTFQFEDGFFALFSEFISGDCLSLDFEGGVLNVVVSSDTKFSLSILVYDELSGELLSDPDTKIFIDGTCSNMSFYGKGDKTNIDASTAVNYVVKIAPRYMIRLNGDENYYASNISGTIVIEENTSLVFYVRYISFVKPILYKENPIGYLKVEYNEYNNEYQLYFGETNDNFVEMTRENSPHVVGYSLLGLFVGNNSLAILDEVTGRYMATQDSYNNFLEDSQPVNKIGKIYFTASEIVATFEPNKYVFNFLFHDENGNEIYFYGLAIYDDNHIYLDRKVVLNSNIFEEEKGKYFGGVSYGSGDDKVVYGISEDTSPVIVYNMDLYRFQYELEEGCVFKTDKNNLQFNIELLSKRFVVEFVFYHEGGSIGTAKQIVRYGDSVSANSVLEKGEVVGDCSTPSYIKGYNFIGFVEDVSKNMVIQGVFEELNCIFQDEVFVVDEHDYRFVAVFAQNIATLRLYNESSILKTVSIVYDSKVDENNIVKSSGNYIVPSKFGYNFVGFYTKNNEGDFDTKVIEYDESKDNPYIFDYTLDYFEFKGGQYYWVCENNISLYAKFVLKDLEIYLFVDSLDYQETDEISSSATVSTPSDQGETWDYLISGFNVTTKNVSILGIEAKPGFFIEYIKIEDNIVYSEKSSNGGEVLDDFSSGEFKNNALTLLVKQYFNESIGDLSLNVYVKYSPVSYLVAFYGQLSNEENEEIATHSAEPIYYLVDYLHREINETNIQFWKPCTEDGVDGSLLEAEGWQDISIGESGITLSYRTLFGASGDIYVDSNNIEFGFKKWSDRGDDEFWLFEGQIIDRELRLYSVFSDKYDVVYCYYLFNDFKNSYELWQKKGYFWIYNSESHNYTLKNAKTFNSYELFLINGEVYFISGYNVVEEIPLNMIDGNVDFGVNQTIGREVGLATSEEYVDLVAVYKPYHFAVSLDESFYFAEVDVPNDPCGNSYSTEDVVFYKLTASDYSTYVESGEYSLFNLFSEDVFEKLVATLDNKISKALVLDNEILVAVIVRKGENGEILENYRYMVCRYW